MENTNQKTSDDGLLNAGLWLACILCFFWLLIPFAIAIIISRCWFKFNNKKQKIIQVIVISMILITVNALCIYWIVDNKSSLFLNYNIIFFFLSIGGLFLTVSYLTMVLISKPLWKLRNKKNKELDELKQKMLKTGQMHSLYFKKEKKLIVKMFSYDILDSIEKQAKEQIKRDDGLYLNKNLFIQDSALRTHTLIYGGTGCGKTNTIIHFIKYALEKNHKVVFVDGKADINLYKDVKNYCNSVDKKMLFWHLNNATYNEFYYNPFKEKSVDEIISLLSEMEGFSDSLENNSDSSYYKKKEKTLFDILIPLMDKMNIDIDFKILDKYTDYDYIMSGLEEANPWLLKQCVDKNVSDEIKNSQKRKIISDLKIIDKQTWTTVNIKMKSYAKSLKHISGKSSSKSIKDLIKKNSDWNLMLFSLPVAGDPTNAKPISKVIMHDIKQNMDFNQTQGVTYLIFDEFGSFGTTVIEELLTQGRSKEYRVILSTQGPSQLKKVSESFFQTITGNTSTKIIHKIEESKIDDILSTLGTVKDREITYRVNDGTTSAAQFDGTGSFKAVDRFRFDPNDIKGLKIGNVVVKTLIDGDVYIYPEIEQVDLIKTDDVLVNQQNTSNNELKNITINNNIDNNNNQIKNNEPSKNESVSKEKEISNADHKLKDDDDILETKQIEETIERDEVVENKEKEINDINKDDNDVELKIVKENEKPKDGFLKTIKSKLLFKKENKKTIDVEKENSNELEKEIVENNLDIQNINNEQLTTNNSDDTELVIQKENKWTIVFKDKKPIKNEKELNEHLYKWNPELYEWLIDFENIKEIKIPNFETFDEGILFLKEYKNYKRIIHRELKNIKKLNLKIKNESIEENIKNPREWHFNKQLKFRFYRASEKVSLIIIQVNKYLSKKFPKGEGI